MINIDPYIVSVAQMREELGNPTDIPTEIGRVYDENLANIRQRNIDLLQLKSRFYETEPLSGAPAVDQRGVFSNYVMSKEEVRAHLAEFNTTFVTDAMITRIINRLVYENLINKVKVPRYLKTSPYNLEVEISEKLEPLTAPLPYNLPLEFTILDHIQLRNEIGDPNTTSITDNELGKIINRNVEAFNIRSRFYQEDPITVGVVPDERGIFSKYVLGKDELRSNLAELNAEFITDGMLQKIINRKVNQYLTKNVKVPRYVMASPYVQEIEVSEKLDTALAAQIPYSLPLEFTIINHTQLRSEIGDPNTTSITDSELGEIIKRNVEAFKIRSRFYQENPISGGNVSDLRGIFANYVLSKDELRMNLAELNSDFVTDGMLQKIINRKDASNLSNHIKIPRFVTQEKLEEAADTDYRVPSGFTVMDHTQLRNEIGDPNVRSITDKELDNIIKRNIGIFKPYQMLEEEYKNVILGKEIGIGFEGVEEVVLTGTLVNGDIVKYEVPEGFYPLPIKMTTTDGKGYAISNNLEREHTISPYVRRRYDVRGNKIHSFHKTELTAKFWLIDRDRLQEYVLSKSTRIAGLSEKINASILREAKEAVETQLKYEEMFTEGVSRTNAEIIAEARVMAENKLNERDRIIALVEGTNSKIIAEAREAVNSQMNYEQVFNDTLARVNAEIIAEARVMAENKLNERDKIIALVQDTNARIIAEAKDMLNTQLQYEDVFNAAVNKTNQDILVQVRTLADNKVQQQEKLMSLIEATNTKIIGEAAAMHRRLVAEGTRLKTSEEITR